MEGVFGALACCFWIYAEALEMHESLLEYRSSTVAWDPVQLVLGHLVRTVGGVDHVMRWRCCRAPIPPRSSYRPPSPPAPPAPRAKKWHSGNRRRVRRRVEREYPRRTSTTGEEEGGGRDMVDSGRGYGSGAVGDRGGLGGRMMARGRS
jgi:hypothetical protein